MSNPKNPKKDETPTKTATVMWFSFEPRDGGYTLHISEVPTESLEKTQIKEFLPDLKTIALNRLDMTAIDILEKLRDNFKP